MLPLLVLSLSFHLSHCSYYQPNNCNKYSWNNAEFSCENGIHGGHYLASIHSDKDIQTIISICTKCKSGQPNYSTNCYIGLFGYKYINDSQTVWKWSDKTYVNAKLISSNFSNFWCNGYPKLLNTNNKTITYVDINQSCIKNSYEINKLRFRICGPYMFPSTLLYWDINFYLQLIFFIPLSVYMIYIFICLYFNLLIKEHNWILQPTKCIRFTAVFIPMSLALILICFIILLSIKYFGWLYTGVMPPDNLFNDRYPHIFYIGDYFAAIILVLYPLTTPIGLYHIFLRLQNLFVHNEFATMVIPSLCKHGQCFYYFIQISAVINGPLFVIFALSIGLLWSDSTKQLIGVLWLISLVFGNLLLLYFYTKGLEIYSHEHHFKNSHLIYAQSDAYRKNPLIMNDKTHELLIHISRYVVVFGASIIVNILVLIIGRIFFYNSDSVYIDNNTGSVITIVILFFKELLFVESIHLSFEFSHTKYTKRCGYFDERIKVLCHKRAKNKQKHLLLELNHIQHL